MPWDCRSRNCELLFTFLRCSFQKHFLLWLIKGGGWEELREREKERDKDKKRKKEQENIKETPFNLQRNKFTLSQDTAQCLSWLLHFSMLSRVHFHAKAIKIQSTREWLHRRTEICYIQNLIIFYALESPDLQWFGQNGDWFWQQLIHPNCTQ